MNTVRIRKFRSRRRASRHSVFGACVGIVLLAFAGVSFPLRAIAVTGDWGPTGIRVGLGDGDATASLPMADGAGGIYVVWTSRVPGGTANEVRVVRVLMHGSRHAAWPVAGVVLGPSEGLMQAKCAPDGGLVVTSGQRAWRLDGNGSMSPGWPAAGVGLEVTGEQPVGIAIDDSAGVWAVGLSEESHTTCIPEGCFFYSKKILHVARLTPDGAPYPGWEAPGRNVLESGGESSPHLAGRVYGFAGGIGFLHSAIPVGYHGERWGCIVYFVTLRSSGAVTTTNVESGGNVNPGYSVGVVDEHGRAFATLGAMRMETSLNLFAPGWQWPGGGWRYAAAGLCIPDGLVLDDADGVYLRSESNPPGSTSWGQRLDHILPGGASDPAWPSFGLALPTEVNQSGANFDESKDFRNGWFASWSQTNGTDADLYAMRVAPTGLPPAGWSPGANALCLATGSEQLRPRVASDQDGTLFVTWLDSREGIVSVYGQRLGADAPVPVLVQHAGASWEGTRALLEWRLESSSPLRVERSHDGVAWEDLCPALAPGGSAETWTAVDESPDPARANHYRLRDPLSAWVGGEVTLDPPGTLRTFRVSVSPNPATAASRIRFAQAPGPTAEWTLTDVLGREHASGVLQTDRDTPFLETSARTGLEAGVYWLRVRSGTEARSTRVVVLP